MNLQSFKGTPDCLKWRFKASERKLSLGAPEYGEVKLSVPKKGIDILPLINGEVNRLYRSSYQYTEAFTTPFVERQDFKFSQLGCVIHVHRLLARILKVGVQLLKAHIGLGGSGGMLPQKILKN